MDAMGAQPVYSVDRGDNYGMGGNWIWVLFLVFILFGFNGGGFGYNRGCATTQDVNSGFNFNSVTNDLRALERGQCSIGYENSQLIAGLNNNMTNGFNNIANGLCDLGYRTQQCCCETNRNIDNVRYEASKNTCDVITAANANTQRIIDTINQNELQKLRDELCDAKLKISNSEQTNNLICALRPTPIPAYITCSPYTERNIGYTDCGTSRCGNYYV